MKNEFFIGMLEQDVAPVVICDLNHTVVYMNRVAIARYHADITGKSIKACHPAYANAKIDEVIEWFKKSPDNNRIFTFRNDEENKDVYMVAIRDENGALIGYTEKHEYRNRETAPLYKMGE